ncbi:hypothetical protein EVAR_54556_1 [Eumeta japonica]|uniref:Uncharacterized protein n=1 Tax=Eumeta variegata TaxID=151549 RepID=A0A4C1YVA2_EUMVA|nr:hypothetical protein EVAR_54556_1 [Eumeta japonica]
MDAFRQLSDPAHPFVGGPSAPECTEKKTGNLTANAVTGARAHNRVARRSGILGAGPAILRSFTKKLDYPPVFCRERSALNGPIVPFLGNEAYSKSRTGSFNPGPGTDPNFNPGHALVAQFRPRSVLDFVIAPTLDFSPLSTLSFDTGFASDLYEAEHALRDRPRAPTAVSRGER